MIRLGQHFFQNKQLLKKIAGLLDLEKGDTVVEIGPGHGELTEEIRSRRPETKIIAIEKDGLLAEGMRKKFSSDKNIKIISGDALQILKKSGFQSLVAGRWELAGNIPYYITGKLLRTIGESTTKPGMCVLTIQKEVAERLAAKAPQMNRLAASVQFWAEPKIAFVISRNDFRPAPEVDSTTIVLRPMARKISPDVYYKTVRALFGQPRKTVLNNLATGMKISKTGVEEILKLAKIDGSLRPQNLSIENIIKIAAVFHDK